MKPRYLVHHYPLQPGALPEIIGFYRFLWWARLRSDLYLRREFGAIHITDIRTMTVVSDWFCQPSHDI